MSRRPDDKLYPGNPLAGVLLGINRRARKAGSPFGEGPLSTGPSDPTLPDPAGTPDPDQSGPTMTP